MFWHILAGAVTGVLSGFGLGGGSLLMLYLTGVAGMGQQAAQGVNLLYFLPCSGAAVAGHIRSGHIAAKAAIFAILAGLAGSAAGAWGASVIDPSWLRRGFGVLLLIVGVRELLAGRKKPKAAH